jgi:hypothetical protein
MSASFCQPSSACPFLGAVEGLVRFVAVHSPLILETKKHRRSVFNNFSGLQKVAPVLKKGHFWVTKLLLSNR